MAVFDIAGRLVGPLKIAKHLSFCFMVICSLMNIFLLLQYFKEWYITVPSVPYILIFSVSLYVFLGGVSTSYFMSQATLKSDGENKDSIGSLMINSLLGGMAAGNVVSIFFAYLKKGTII